MIFFSHKAMCLFILALGPNCYQDPSQIIILRGPFRCVHTLNVSSRHLRWDFNGHFTTYIKIVIDRHCFVLAA
jgi:hypothetical protein